MDVEVAQQRAGSTHSPTTQAAGPWVESSRRGDPSSFSHSSLTTQCGSALALTRPDDLALDAKGNNDNKLNKCRQATGSPATTELNGRKVKNDGTRKRRTRGQKIRRVKKSRRCFPSLPAPTKLRLRLLVLDVQPIRSLASCGVACAIKCSRTVEVRSSPQGNQSFGSRTDAVGAQMADER